MNESPQTKHKSSDLGKELNQLGENLAKLLKVLCESDESKCIERELNTQVRILHRRINHALKVSQTDQKVRKAKESFQDAWQTAHGPQVLSEVHMGLVDSLNRLNDEIARRSATPPAHEVVVDYGTKPAAVH